MKRNPRGKIEADRAAIYARVSDKSQAEEDKTSISEQISEMEAYCERTGLTIVARYQELAGAGPRSARSSSGCSPTQETDASTPSSAGSPTG